MFLTTARRAVALVAGLALAAGHPGTAAPVPAERVRAEQAERDVRLKTEKELAVVAARLAGSWECLPCKGRLTLNPGGTYEWVDIADQGDLRHRGTWRLGGSADAPTLLMTCITARFPKDDTVPEVEGRLLTWTVSHDADELTLDGPSFVPFYRAK